MLGTVGMHRMKGQFLRAGIEKAPTEQLLPGWGLGNEYVFATRASREDMSGKWISIYHIVV